jgi:single-strand DNA-binding protein
LELNANIIDLIGKRSEGSAQQGYSSTVGQTARPSAQQATSHDNFDEPYDDDIPF